MLEDVDRKRSTFFMSTERGVHLMAKQDTYVKRTTKFLETLQDTMDFEIVNVEFVKENGTWYLRAYCDKQGGIGVDDCADISRKVSKWLDKEDFISESYILEVSSPGFLESGLSDNLKGEKEK